MHIIMSIYNRLKSAVHCIGKTEDKAFNVDTSFPKQYLKLSLEKQTHTILCEMNLLH